jgi:caspase domain-containing protein
MKRRTFLATSIALATQFIAHSVVGQGGQRGPRAAVVIGINRAGSLPVLSAAASGAHQVADWLRAEGFDVKLFTDEQSPVKASEIFDAVAELVNRGTLEQLVIYFSGHGFLSGYIEYWMLSGAPGNPNEAISLRESVDLARESAIPSVVFISDACRSTPESISSSRVRGSLIFPNGSGSRVVHTDVDQFLATLPGDPAFEIPVSQSAPGFQGIYTASFLSAFRDPSRPIVRTVEGVSFIPNRNLEPFLEDDVRKRDLPSSWQSGAVACQG